MGRGRSRSTRARETARDVGRWRTRSAAVGGAGRARRVVRRAIAATALSVRRSRSGGVPRRRRRFLFRRRRARPPLPGSRDRWIQTSRPSYALRSASRVSAAGPARFPGPSRSALISPSSASRRAGRGASLSGPTGRWAIRSLTQWAQVARSSECSRTWHGRHRTTTPPATPRAIPRASRSSWCASSSAGEPHR